MQKATVLIILFLSKGIYAQNLETVFEKSNGTKTVTYQQFVSFYKKLDTQFNTIKVKDFGNADAGKPLQVVCFSKDQSFNPTQWHTQKKIVILINNGIHPGEPDGIDASMLLLRDLAQNNLQIDDNIVLAVIPVYNIGGALNRNNNTRVNQNGPDSFGFRGNAQNLDLNRDFIKSDSKEAKEFAKIFHWLSPDIFIDNHVSDGADYQHTMTLLTTQHSKLNSVSGKFLHDVFEPALYKSMEEKKWPMCPYVNFETANPDKGWDAFYDPPRYSSGYASLFQTLSFVPETHMLKPYADRVKSTYAFMQTMIEQASKYATTIIANRKASLEAIKQQKMFALNWKIDSTKSDVIKFLGYDTAYKKSDVTGMDRLFYNHSKPFTKQVKLYNYYVGEKLVAKPKAYIIPQGWYAVIDLLKLNKVAMQQLKNDTVIQTSFYKIADFKTSPKAYEKHYPHYDVTVTTQQEQTNFLKGDYIIYTGQTADRFLIETLEPAATDSYFSWNFFDAILQQKEGYSDYRWEDIAAKYIQQHPELKQQLEEKKKTDTAFAASSSAQLNFVYKNSIYYEKAHLRYPVYRIDFIPVK